MSQQLLLTCLPYDRSLASSSLKRQCLGVQFSNINISQGSVAMRLRYGGIFSGHFIANVLLSVPMKQCLNSVSISQRQRTRVWRLFFWLTVLCTIYGGHFPVLIKFPDFSRCLRHTGDSIQIGLGVLVREQESMNKYLLINK